MFEIARFLKFIWKQQKMKYGKVPQSGSVKVKEFNKNIYLIRANVEETKMANHKIMYFTKRISSKFL